MSPESRQLPIHAVADRILNALARTPTLVLEAPTGSGKSTQVPQLLLDHGVAGKGKVVVLQPRRLAARMLARRVAWERGVTLGEEVGYQVRLEHRAGPRTRIKFETEGVILRQLLSDARLSDVSVLIFDEFHERHVHADVMLPLALKLQRSVRPDLKLVVMSATLDGAGLTEALAPCERVCAEGRTFPVEIHYAAEDPRSAREPVWTRAAEALRTHRSLAGDGHVLVFMPGAYEIQRTVEGLRDAVGRAWGEILPLHGELPPDAQDRAVGPSTERKVVVATNIAETSLTIDGIALVVDSGLARRAAFDPVRGINTLLIEPISKAAADQRAGRAGRTGPGHCLRLWSPADHAARADRETPEIQRIDPSEILLTLLALGVVDVTAFPWLDPPRREALERALRLLRDLGALDATGGLTALGARLSRFPLHPRHARMLVAGGLEGCLRDTALIAALCQERDLVMGRQNSDVVERRERVWGDCQGSDLVRGLQAWAYARERDFDVEGCRSLGLHAQTARRVGDLARQFLALAEAEGLADVSDTPKPEALARAILAGFSDQLGRRVNAEHRRYALVHGRRATLDRESAATGADFVVASEIQEIGRSRGDVEVRLTQATAVEAAWLHDLFPDDWSEHRVVELDTAIKRVVLRREIRFRDLLIEERRGGDPTPDEAAQVLAAEVHAGRLTLKQWDHRVEQWVARLNLLAGHCPEWGLPPITVEARRDLVEQICHGAYSYKEIKEKPVWPVVHGWLSAGQHAVVDRHAPTRITLSNGRNAALTYAEGAPPFLALRVQDLYDVTAPVTVAQGRVRVRVHVLAPNQRPVQITDDLGSFWANTYAQVKKDLRGRYPKHEWR